MKKTIQQERWQPFIRSILFFAVAFTIAMFLHWPIFDAAGVWVIFMKFGAVSGLLGSIYGAIYAFDVRFNPANVDRPVLRTVVCAGLGGLLIFSLEIPSPTRSFEPVALGAGIAGFLGWFGWRWARHVEF